MVHNHSHSIIPFGVTDTPLQPMIHTGAAIGPNIPIWDINDEFGDTDLLVRNMDHGRDMAKTMGDATVVLMRGNGCTAASRHIPGAFLIGDGKMVRLIPDSSEVERYNLNVPAFRYHSPNVADDVPPGTAPDA
ncbi:MAG: class II aldolase/adducin family protein [Rhizobiaceae bacterium]|nr:class II aldolase/adducin family protein [Rhizobiaceae bacterium]